MTDSETERPRRRHSWGPDTPTFSAPTVGHETLRFALVRGWGISAWCADCDFLAAVTCPELLERFWKVADLPTREIMARAICRRCGSKRLKLNRCQGGATLPIRSYRLEDAHLRDRDMEDRIDSWIETRQDAEKPRPAEAERGK
ncbi:MAG: hypothetical protein ACYDD1_09520 [Caulobacteraceae bacterium]